VPVVRKVEQRKQGNRNNQIKLGYTHIKRIPVDIQLIALHMIDKVIDNVEIAYDDSEIIISLDDGTSIELTIDSIHMNIPEVDD